MRGAETFRKKEKHNKSRPNYRHRCPDFSLTDEECTMAGYYRFNQEQEELYINFVNMLASFDQFDMVKF
jgi:hypothetical protein